MLLACTPDHLVYFLKLHLVQKSKILFKKVQITFRSSKLKTEFDEFGATSLNYLYVSEISTFGSICNEICTKFATNLQKRSFFWIVF